MTRLRRRAVVLALLTGLVLVTGGAALAIAPARSATAEETAALARQATTDDGALRDLRDITRVDGRPVDLAAATRNLGTHRAERLASIAAAFDQTGGPGGSPTLDRDQARRLANDVLDDRKYQEQRLPKPFKGVLEWLGDRLRPVGRAFQPVGDAIEAIPGGPYLVLGALGLGLGWAIWRLISGRARSAVRAAPGWSLVDPEQDPTELERAADAADAAGHHALAVRARYEAGLLRLARSGRIELRPETTASTVARDLGDPVLHDLTATFEAVVYGDQPATAGDSAAARSGWAQVLHTRVAA